MATKDSSWPVTWFVVVVVAVLTYFGINHYCEDQDCVRAGFMNRVNIDSGYGAQPPPLNDVPVIPGDLLSHHSLSDYIYIKSSDVLLC